MRFITESEVEHAFTPALALEAAPEAFLALAAGTVTMPQRASLPATGGAYLVMPCAAPGVGLGTKLVTVHAENAAKGLPTIHSSYVLQDDATGEPLAVLEARALTERRTAAVSALAARSLARGDAQVLGVIGAGPQARAQAEAHLHAHSYARVLVWNRSSAGAEQLVGYISGLGFRAEVASGLEFLVRESDVISSATRAEEPLILGGWLRPGQHLDLVGAFTPTMREADADAVKRAHVTVDRLEAARNGAGELLQAVYEGWGWADVVELADIVVGRQPGRTSNEAITLFKSVGLAAEDLFAARAVLRALG